LFDTEKGVSEAPVLQPDHNDPSKEEATMTDSLGDDVAKPLSIIESTKHPTLPTLELPVEPSSQLQDRACNDVFFFCFVFRRSSRSHSCCQHEAEVQTEAFVQGRGRGEGGGAEISKAQQD
jgi:hypothetical protein